MLSSLMPLFRLILQSLGMLSALPFLHAVLLKYNRWTIHTPILLASCRSHLKANECAVLQ